MKGADMINIILKNILKTQIIKDINNKTTVHLLNYLENIITEKEIEDEYDIYSEN